MFQRLKTRLRILSAVMRGWVQVDGHRVYFPTDSEGALRYARTGSYEPEMLEIMLVACRDASTVFDVGANIGLSAIQLLQKLAGIQVYSFEASPVVLPCLIRTNHESSFKPRWHIIDKAVSELPNQKVTYISHRESGGVYDGLMETHRVSGTGQQSELLTTSIDYLWQSAGMPDVSLIKIDVEGAELRVLKGATECLNATKPVILAEWYAGNFKAYGLKSTDILDFAHSVNYEVFFAPSMLHAMDHRLFPYQLTVNYNLILLPRV